MDAVKRVDAGRQRWPEGRGRGTLVVAVMGSLVAGVVGLGVSVRAGSLQASGLEGTARVTGTVTAPQPFQAAQVRLRHVDKNILYMVFTQAGQFRAVALFPGNYEVSVRAPGLESEVQKLTLRAGDNSRLQVALRPAGGGQAGDLLFQSYEEVYPPGPGREVAEQVCMVCHGENFLPSRPASAEVWRTRINFMMGADLNERDASATAQGLLAGRTNLWRFSPKDREALLAYLVQHFGPDRPRRAVRTDRPMPLDEAALGTAMFIEHYMKPDGSGEGANAPQFAGKARPRWIQDPRFDAEGNVWMTDRGVPERLVKLDPRTGEQKYFLYPHPGNGAHEILIDRQGMIWLPEHGGLTPSEEKHLLMFNPKTERFEKIIPMDPENVIRNSNKWMNGISLDSKGNIYVSWSMGGALSRYDRATGQVKVYRIPTPHAMPYGNVADRNDNIWLADWSTGKLAKFDTASESWTEFTPPTYPGQTRRLFVDSQNNIWTGIWAAGKRPGKIAKLDQTRGRWTEWDVPQQYAQPYDVSEDLNGNIWFPDSPTPDRSSAIGMLNPRNGRFTFYPKPQPQVDTPKIQVTRDGAVWFAERTARGPLAAISVLYPDMSKITTLGAYYRNGPPGYAFSVSRPATE